MPRRATPIRTPVILLALLASLAPAVADEPSGTSSKGASAQKKVLVELYTSQGCNSCPAAEKVFGRLEALGVDRDRFVPVAFHVDYFNKPWRDPYSDPLFSRREYQYSLVYQKAKKIDDPNYLYFTPLMMVDGRHPMLGSNVAEAKKSLALALAEKPGVGIEGKLDGAASDPRRKLKVTVTARSPGVVDRSLIVGVALTENPITTKIESGENEGKTLIEHHATRQFEAKPAKLGRGESRSFEFPLSLPAGGVADRFSVAIFVQDIETGRIHQAESVRWVEPKGRGE